MPNSLGMIFALGYSGYVKGIPSNTALQANLGYAPASSLSGTTKQVYVQRSLTVTATGSTTLDLTTGLVNVLGESITGTAQFTQVFGYVIEHVVDSSAADVLVFGGGSNDFQGPLGVTNRVTLKKGSAIGYIINESVTGDTVDGTNKNIRIVNTSSVVATVNIAVFGNRQS